MFLTFLNILVYVSFNAFSSEAVSAHIWDLYKRIVSAVALSSNFYLFCFSMFYPSCLAIFMLVPFMF